MVCLFLSLKKLRKGTAEGVAINQHAIRYSYNVKFVRARHESSKESVDKANGRRHILVVSERVDEANDSRYILAVSESVDEANDRTYW